MEKIMKSKIDCVVLLSIIISLIISFFFSEKNLDICSYNRLEELDKGIQEYDVVLSESLPYIVMKYN